MTGNLTDFPPAATPAGITVLSADDFVLSLIDVDIEAVLTVVEQQAGALSDPPMTTAELLAGLAIVGLRQSVDAQRAAIWPSGGFAVCQDGDRGVGVRLRHQMPVPVIGEARRPVWLTSTRRGTGDAEVCVRRRRALVLFFLAGAVALPACGGPTSADFIKKADEHCRVGDVALNGIVKPSDYATLAGAAETLVRVTDEQVASLRKLAKPGGSEKQRIDSVLNDLGAVTGPARTVEDQATARELAAGSAAVDTRSKAQAAEASASAYGLKECGTGTLRAAAAIYDGAAPVVKTAFLTKADAVCMSALSKFRLLARPTASEAIPAYLTSLIGILQELLDGLKPLVPPPGEEATVTEILTGFQKQRVSVQAELDAANRNDAAGAKAAGADALKTGMDASAKASAFGLSSC